MADDQRSFIVGQTDIQHCRLHPPPLFQPWRRWHLGKGQAADVRPISRRRIRASGGIA
jgi:hypothetical protein